jgi:hypothetical protein
MITTPFPSHTSDNNHTYYVSYFPKEEIPRDRHFQDRKKKMEKGLGLWGRIKRKVWETKIHSEIEIAKSVEEVREKVCLELICFHTMFPIQTELKF